MASKTRKCLACLAPVEKVANGWICIECGSRFKLTRRKKGQKYVWQLMIDDAAGGLTEKGQIIANERRQSSGYFSKYKKENPWKRITDARQFPTVYTHKTEENRYRVLVPARFTGFLYCPSCGKKAQQTTLASGVLEYKCRNTKGNKKCGALVEFHLGGDLWNLD